MAENNEAEQTFAVYDEAVVPSSGASGFIRRITEDGAVELLTCDGVVRARPEEIEVLP